jgi:hypothetical protein
VKESSSLLCPNTFLQVPFASHRSFSRAHPTFIHLACPATDGADEATSLSFPREVANLVGPPRHRILMHICRHSESKSRLVGSSVYHSTTPNVAAAMVIAHPYPPPFFPLINDELPLNFARTLRSSELAPRYLLPRLDCSPTPSPRHRFLGWSHHSPDRCRSLGGFFTIRTHALFVPVRGGE